MIKKYVMIIAVLLVILMFTSTSTASFLFLSKGEIYERLPENFKTMLDRLYQVAYNNDDDVALDADEEDDETDDEEDDDGMTDLDDGPEENVLLPKIWDLVGKETPDDGNEPVDDSEDTPTVDSDGEVGATPGEWTVDSDGDEGVASNEITTDEGEWAVDHDGEGGTLERFIEIVTERNVELGALLQRIIERTVVTDENGISSPGSGGSAENNNVDDVVVTDGDQ